MTLSVTRLNYQFETHTMCRAGLHLGVTTVGRILKEEPQSDPQGMRHRALVYVTAKHADLPFYLGETNLTEGK